MLHGFSCRRRWPLLHHEGGRARRGRNINIAYTRQPCAQRCVGDAPSLLAHTRLLAEKRYIGSLGAKASARGLQNSVM